METIGQLEEIRSRMRSAREGRILIGTGVCGIAAGAKGALKASQEELVKRGLIHWVIEQTGCLGFCDREPLMIVEKPGQRRVIYYAVDDQRARQIIVNHIVNNVIVGSWVLPEEEANYS